MKQGNQFYLEIQLEDEDSNILNIDSVSKVQFVIDDMIKTYDGASDEVTYDKDNQCFKIWLTEDETFELDRNIKIDARILFKNDTIGGSYITETYFYSSLKQEILDDGEAPTPSPSGDLSEYFNTLIPTYENGQINSSNIIKKIPVLTIDENATDLNSAFNYGVTYHNELELNIKSKNITNCKNMFFNASLSKIKFNNDFDTSNVTDMSYMFTGNYFISIDLSNFNTSNVIDMSSMFENDINLETLDLSNFNTNKVTNMKNIFYGLISLKNLNISNFDFTNVSEYDAMFGETDGEISTKIPTDCYILVKDAKAKEWITSKFDWLTNVHYVGE